jgi:hypothetical protein
MIEILEAEAPKNVKKAIFFDASLNKVDAKEEKRRVIGTPVIATPTRKARAKRALANVWTLCATESDGVALESGDLKHGVFSYYFAEGLTEKGDANGDGVVTLMEAFLFAKAHTRGTVAKDFGYEQTPVLVGPLADVEMRDLKAEVSGEEKSEAEDASK